MSSRWILAAGAAALAIATPTLAQRGGGDNKGGGGKPAKADHAQHGGGAKPDRAGPGHDRAGGGGGKQARVETSGGQMRHAQVDRPKGPDKMRAAKPNRADMRENDRATARNDSKRDRVRAEKGGDRVRVADRDRTDRDNFRLDDRDRAQFDRSRLVRFDDDERGFRGLANGCPPGLAGKNELCLPPGQYKKLGSVLPAAFASRTLDGAYSQWYRDDDRYMYRNDGDYIYRVNRNGGLIDALFPSADRDFSYYPIGMNYPSQFDQYNVPDQFRSLYPDGGDYDYRYGDGAIYQVDPSTKAIQSIVALLAGDLGVGQQMPSNYGAYNVPLAYRDRYYDTPDATYRYNDGYIYQADPKTQLITAVIDAIV